MSKTEIITLLLSSAVLSGVVTVILTYFLDLRKNKDSRNFQLRQDAYMKAIASVSGASDTIFDYFIKKHSIDGRINPIVVTEFVAAHTRAIAPAILVSNDTIRAYLEKFAPLIIEGAAIIEEVSASTEKTDHGYVARADSSTGKRLLNWRDEVEKLENDLIHAMQRDMGLKD